MLPTLDGFALRSASRAVDPPPRSDRRLSEVQPVKFERALVGVVQVRSVVLVTHPEVRKVVVEEAEHTLAVVAVGASIQDVCVADGVDDLARDDRVVGPRRLGDRCERCRCVELVVEAVEDAIASSNPCSR